MSVIGLDFGNENCVIGIAKQRGIDVLLNEESNRETPAVVSFGEKQRFLGLAGAASATMNPKSTISQVKRMIGVKYRELEEDLRLLPFETSEGSDGGILIHVHYFNEKHSFTPVQILAMLFAHLKQMSEKSLEMPISDCVIGIPSYFTDLQRRAYLDAAEIAGLHPSRLMHDCTAIALGYGIYRTEFPSKDPINVVFVDIGHCDTQVTVAAFRPGRMKILSNSFDRNLGGRNFDEVLFKHFATEFKEHYNIDVYSSTRASVRLRVECEKLKKVLSANPEAPLNIECLMDEKDVKGFIKREDFEKLSSDLFERIWSACNNALLDSGLSMDEIHSVELIGSGSRIPAVKKILASLFGTEPRRTLNASECVARGCALQCAMLSPIRRVKEYEFTNGILRLHRSNWRPVSESVHGGMTRAELLYAQQKELQLTQQDTKMERTQEKKNLLESYVYETRTTLFNTYWSFATESEREGISQNLQKTEYWLYEDGDDESEIVYTEKLAHLKQIVDPIECRYRDEEARVLATRRLLNCIEDYRKAVGSLPSYQKEAVMHECNKAEQWLSEKNQQQESMPKNADPVLRSSEIKRKADTLDAMCNQIMKFTASATEPGEIMDDRNEEDDNMSVDWATSTVQINP